MLLVVILMFGGQLHAETVIQTGVAAPQSGESHGNKEKLRQRAMRNAMELALMQVNGAEISSDRGSMDYSRDSIRITNGKIDEKQNQTVTFHAAAKTKVFGGVKVLKIIKEWQEGDHYFMRLKLDVMEEEKLLESTTVGALWERVSKPALGLDVQISRNNSSWSQSHSFQSYLENNFSQNNLSLKSEADKHGVVRFHIKVKQEFDNAFLQDYGTYKTNCELSFAVIDKEVQNSRANFRVHNGPEAGFSEKQTEDRCISAIAQKFSEKLLKSLADIFNNEWNNGKDFSVSVRSLPGKYVTRANDTIGNAYLVSSSELQGFSNGTLTVDVAYKGKGFQLVESINLAFFGMGMKVDFTRIQGNHVEFVWLGISE